MIIDDIFPEIIISSIILIGGGIFAYLRKKFTCQNQIQRKLDSLDSKINAMIGIQGLILEKTNPELVKEYKKLLDLGKL